MKIIELREYRIQTGKKEQWLTWMHEEILPYQRSKGMKIIDTYINKGDNGFDYFVWLREFDDEASRQRIHQATYNEHWIQNIRPKVFELIDEHSISVRLLEKVEL